MKSINLDLCLKDNQYSDFKQFAAYNSMDWLWIQKGKLCPVKGIANQFLYLISKRKHEEKIKKRVDSLIEILDRSSSKVLLAHRKEIRELFFKKLALFDEHIFNRGMISPHGRLERLLFPSLQERIENLAQEKISKSDKEFQKTILEARFTVKLGLKPILASEGSTGTYFVTDRFGKKIGVFKPITEGHVLGGNNPRLFHRITRLFHYTGARPQETDLTEVAASELDRFLELGIVPRTDRITLKSENFRKEKEQTGSFQLFSEGKEAYRVFQFSFLFRLLPRTLLRWFLFLPFMHHRVEMLIPSDYEKLALLDLLIFNYDRHFRNWLIEHDGQKDTIAAIDNGTSFPTKHPSFDVNFFRWYLDRRHRYLWEILPAANQPFSHKMKRLILRIDGEELAQALRPHLADLARPSSFKACEKRIQCLQERIRYLQKSVKQNKTIRQIALKNFYLPPL
jgi:hypothetical protein